MCHEIFHAKASYPDSSSHSRKDSVQLVDYNKTFPGILLWEYACRDLKNIKNSFLFVYKFFDAYLKQIFFRSKGIFNMVNLAGLSFLN